MITLRHVLLFSILVFCPGLSFSHMASGSNGDNHSGSRLSCIVLPDPQAAKQCLPANEASVHAFTPESGKSSVNAHVWTDGSGKQGLYSSCSDGVSLRCQVGEALDNLPGTRVLLYRPQPKQNDTALFPMPPDNEPPEPLSPGAGLDPFDQQQSPTHMTVTVSLKDLEKNRHPALRLLDPGRRLLPVNQLIQLGSPGQPDHYLLIAGDGSYRVFDGQEGTLLSSLLVAGLVTDLVTDVGEKDRIRDLVAALNAHLALQAMEQAQNGPDLPVRGYHFGMKKVFSAGARFSGGSGTGGASGSGSASQSTYGAYGTHGTHGTHGNGGGGFQPPDPGGSGQNTVNQLLLANPETSGPLLAILAGVNPFTDGFVGYDDQDFIAYLQSTSDLTPGLIMLEGRIRAGEVQYGDWITDPQLRQSRHANLEASAIPVSRYYLALMPRVDDLTVMRLADRATELQLLNMDQFRSFNLLINVEHEDSIVNQDRLFDRILTANPDITWQQMNNLMQFTPSSDQSAALNPHTTPVSGYTDVPGRGRRKRTALKIPDFSSSSQPKQPILAVQAHVTQAQERAQSKDRQTIALNEVIQDFIERVPGFSQGYQWNDLYQVLLGYINDPENHDPFIVDYQHITTRGSDFATTLREVISLLQGYQDSPLSYPAPLMVIRAFTVSGEAEELADTMTQSYQTARSRFPLDLPDINNVDFRPVSYPDNELVKLAINLEPEMTDRWLVQYEVTNAADALWAILELTKGLHQIQDPRTTITDMLGSHPLSHMRVTLLQLFQHTHNLGLPGKVAVVGLLKAIGTRTIQAPGLEQAFIGLATGVWQKSSSIATKAALYRLIADTLGRDLKITSEAEAKPFVQVPGPMQAATRHDSSVPPMVHEAYTELKHEDSTDIMYLLYKAGFTNDQADQLGLFLGLQENAKCEYKNMATGPIKTSQVLSRWFNWCFDYTKFGKPSIASLVTALQTFNPAAAEFIKKKYSSSPDLSRTYDTNDLSLIINELGNSRFSSADWQALGLNLGLPFYNLQAIEIEQSTVKRAMTETLNNWLKGMGKPCTKKLLVQAMRDCGDYAAAEKIQNSQKL